MSDGVTGNGKQADPLPKMSDKVARELIKKTQQEVSSNSWLPRFLSSTAESLAFVHANADKFLKSEKLMPVENKFNFHGIDHENRETVNSFLKFLLGETKKAYPDIATGLMLEEKGNLIKLRKTDLGSNSTSPSERRKHDHIEKVEPGTWTYLPNNGKAGDRNWHYGLSSSDGKYAYSNEKYKVSLTEDGPKVFSKNSDGKVNVTAEVNAETKKQVLDELTKEEVELGYDHNFNYFRCSGALGGFYL